MNIIPEYVVHTRKATDLRESNQIVMRFPNNYGASIIQGKHTYGGSDGLYEIAVIYFDNDNHYYIDNDNPLSNGDVFGYLTDDDVAETLNRILNLPLRVEN